MRSGLFLPLFDPLADPAAVARLAGEAEEAGWDGFFVWDQIHWREPVAAVGDTQVTLAAIAAVSHGRRLRHGRRARTRIDPVPYGEAGATRCLVAPEWEGISVDQVHGVIRDGPMAPRHVKHDGAARPPTSPLMAI